MNSGWHRARQIQRYMHCSVNPVPNAQVCATQVLHLPTYLWVTPLCGIQQNLAWGLSLHRMDHFERVKCLVTMETELNCYSVLTQGFAGSQKDFFFSFFSRSQCVPFKFSMGSQYVAQVPNVFPNIFSIASHFNPICFGKLLSSFHPYGWAKREELNTSKQNLLSWGASIVSFFCVMGQSNWFIVRKKNNKIGRHLINRRGEQLGCSQECHSVIHINYIMGAFTTFLFILMEPY